MCSSSSSVSTFLPIHLPPRNRLIFHFSYKFPILTKTKFISFSASITQINLQLCSDRPDVDDYNGWAVLEQIDFIPKPPEKGLPKLMLFGVGTSVMALLAVFAHFTLSKKGFVLRFSSPFHVFVNKKSLNSEDASSNVDEVVNEPLTENIFEKEVIDDVKSVKGKPGRIIVPVYADSTQQEALSWLKNLMIIEDEVKADKLCTRREYARWLVLVNSRLERNPTNRIVPSVALAGSINNAFDDVTSEDPDFEYIQALAESGVVLSKLSSKI